MVAQAAPAELRRLTLLNVAFGAGPTLLLWLGKLVIDAVAGRAGAAPIADAWAAVAASPTLLLAMGGVVVGTVALDAVQTLGAFQFGAMRDRVEGAIKARIYESVASFEDIALFETPALLDVKQRAEQSITRVRQLVNIVTNLITGVSVSVPVLALSATIAWWVPLLVFLSALPSAYVHLRYENRAWSVEDAQAGTVRRMRIYEGVLSGPAFAKELRLFGLQTLFLDRWRARFESAFGEMQGVRREGALAVSAWAVVSGFGAAVPYAYVTAAALAGALTLGDLALYAGLVFQVRRSLFILIGNAANLHEAALAADSLFRLLDLRSGIGRAPGVGRVAPGPAGADGAAGIALQDVWFAYPGGDAPVLRGVSLSIRPGEVVALVGENGAGKSTLAKLLCRLYDPQAGTITWDGTDLRAMDLNTLRRRIAVVMQDYAQFPTTLGENIGFGLLARREDEAAVRRAAERAGLVAVMRSLPRGLDTPLSKQFEYGTDLSAGQWQRVAIARALLRLPEAQLLILDEPTAALDPNQEHEVLTLLKDMTREKMALVISHRLALARAAHTVLVLERGAVVEAGPHDALMAQRGPYHAMFTRQAGSYVDVAASAPVETAGKTRTS
ncbi:MAG: ABC transporter ATP-binding protein [Chloroflexota bacterium]